MKTPNSLIRLALVVLFILIPLVWMTGCMTKSAPSTSKIEPTNHNDSAAQAIAKSSLRKACLPTDPSSEHNPALHEMSESRPGLATGWGKSKTSRIRYTDFTRKPNSLTKQIAYYNDREGAQALQNARGSRLLIPIYPAAFSTSGPLSISLESPFGETFTHYRLDSQTPVFVGEAGAPYVITLRNKTNHRVEAVVSVDGLDVMDGKSASPNNRGYIVGPRDTLRIPGFRQSMNEIARFEFSSVANSYANQTGGEAAARNVGLIGLAMFEEKNDDLEARQAADPFPNKFAQPPPAS